MDVQVPALASVIKPSVVARFAPYHHRAVKLLDKRDWSGAIEQIVKEMKKQGKRPTKDWVGRLILALKQYYLIAAIDPRNEHAVSPQVDQGWHADMLDNIGFDEFCKVLIGGRMKHVPLRRKDKQMVGYVVYLYGFTMERYDEVFTRVDREFWPKKLGPRTSVCLHQGIRHRKAYNNALFPANPRAQRPAMTMH